VSRLPSFEFPGDVFLAGLAQFRHDSSVLCGQPIVQLVQCLDGREHLFWDLDNFAGHSAIVSLPGRKDNQFIPVADGGWEDKDQQRTRLRQGYGVAGEGSSTAIDIAPMPDAEKVDRVLVDTDDVNNAVVAHAKPAAVGPF
jgi:hypothetical protein